MALDRKDPPTQGESNGKRSFTAEDYERQLSLLNHKQNRQEQKTFDDVPRLPMPSKNPLPLSSAQEAQVQALYHSRIRGYCAAEIKLFADCATGRTFTAPFKCREQNRAMNTCMLAHATQAEQDASREDWFANRLKRQKEREAKEERRIEQEKFYREWWDLPVEDRAGEKGLDVVKRAENVGGFPSRDEGQLSKDRHR